MKSVLHIVAAVLIAAGLVVAVASLLTPGQVILGIDFKLAATLVIGGLILLALANALALLERMSNDLRQLRKAGSEAPPWLRQAGGQSGIQAAAALALAEGAGSAETGRQGPGREPAQEVGHDIGDQPTVTADAEWPQATETDWPQASEVQWPDTPEPEPEHEPETPDSAREEEAELPFPPAPAPADQAGYDQEPGFEPEPEPEPEPRPETEAQVADASEHESEPEPAEAAPDYGPEEPSEPQPVEPQPVEAQPVEAEPVEPEPVEPEPVEPEPVEPEPVEPEPVEPEPVEPEPVEPEPVEPEPVEPETAAVGDHAEEPRRLKSSQYTPWSPEEPTDPAEEPEKQEHFSEADAPETETPQEPSPEDQPSALYVVEERMFRDKQARVLSDGTVEAETAEGWMRFEDFDHLEEYLDAMAELGR